MEILDSYWLNGSILFVKAKTDAGETKIYFGRASGFESMRDNEAYIAGWGSELDPEMFIKFLEGSS